MADPLPTIGSMLSEALPAKYIRGLKRQEYDQLVASGAFTDERVELLEGVIVRMPPHGPLHDGTLDILVECLQPLSKQAKLRVQSSFAASDGSEPEPDIAVVPRADYRERHPNEAYLIIEISDSSLERDRTVKARIYAQSGVPEYWVVTLVESKLIVFRTPGADGYETVSTHRAGDTICPQHFPSLKIQLATLLEPTIAHQS